MNDRYWMEKAFEQALLAQKEGELPIGAVLISKDKQLIGVGRNQEVHTHDPSQHAEMVAIRAGAQFLKNHRLIDTTLYVTLEPCVMCAGLLVHARIKRLVYATRDLKTGASGSLFNLLKGFPLNHKVIIDEGIMQQECSTLLLDFFNKKRRG